ncbi:MAG: sulfatase-like hydrolase/transferase [Bryobacterales bacterium]
MGRCQQGFQWGRETFGSHPWAYKAAEDPYTDLPEGEYAPDSLTDDAIAFLSQGGDKPFFLYASYPYVHTPVRARGRWLEEKYRAKLGPDATDKRVLYGGFVETFDHNVGRLIDAASRIENTLIVFTSDNGGHPEYAVNAPLRGSKWNLYEGGIRVPLLVRWDGRVKPGWSAARRSPASTGSPRWLKPRARKLLRRIRPACSRCSKEAPHGRSKSGR